jgi:hypothetical protein
MDDAGFRMWLDAYSARDGILLVAFTDDGRCRDHREWFVSRDLPG